MPSPITRVKRMSDAFRNGIRILKKIEEILKNFSNSEDKEAYFTGFCLDENQGKLFFFFLGIQIYIRIKLYYYIANDIPRYCGQLEWGLINKTEVEEKPKLILEFGQIANATTGGYLCTQDDYQESLKRKQIPARMDLFSKDFQKSDLLEYIYAIIQDKEEKRAINED